jgi:hypothetical protein
LFFVSFIFVIPVSTSVLSFPSTMATTIAFHLFFFRSLFLFAHCSLQHDVVTMLLSSL